MPTHRLLVVEDEEHLAAGLKLNLELEGYAVDLAGTAREAGEHLLKRAAYDAIVLDVQLPDVDGFELCRKLRSAGNYTPVIMLTARAAAEDRVHGLEVGADDYLVKPFELDELLAADDAARVLDEVAHHVELEAGHLQRLAVDHDLVGV